MASIEVFDNFGALDGLMQGGCRRFFKRAGFIDLEVGIADWSVELGLVEENLWWKGSWLKEDVIRQVKKPTTEKDVEDLAEKLASLIVSGELSIEGWSDSRSKDLQIIIGSDIGVDLQRLPDDESPTRALELLKKIALRAQLHDYRLFKTGPAEPALSKGNNQQDARAPTIIETFEEKEHELGEAQKRIKELESQVSVVKQMVVAERDTKRLVVPKAPHGASRANPTRQKRKIVEAEFESD